MTRPSTGDILGLMADLGMSDVGGTPGGLGSFLLGFAMACVGAYLISNQVTVGGGYWGFYGGNTFGITLIPMLIGIAMLFFGGRPSARLAADGGRGALHSGRRDRQSAHLVSAYEPVEHADHAGAAGGRAGADRARTASSGRRVTTVTALRARR